MPNGESEIVSYPSSFNVGTFGQRQFRSLRAQAIRRRQPRGHRIRGSFHKNLRATVHCLDRGIRRRFPHPAKRLRRKKVVAVQPPDHVAGRRAQPFVQRVVKPRVRLADHAQMRIPREQFHRAIRGHAIDHDVLHVGIVLRQHTLDRLPEKMRAVQRRRDDRNAHG